MTRPRRSRKRARAKPAAVVSLRQLAKRLGIDESAVRKRLRAGGFSAAAIARGPNGRPRVVDPELAAREWQANRAKPTPTSPAASQEPQVGRPQTLTEAQIRVNFQRELKLELENLQRRGVLIDAALARRQNFERARTSRDSMLNIPDRVSAQLAAETESTRCHQILTTEIRAALAALADVLDADDDSDAGSHGGADAA